MRISNYVKDISLQMCDDWIETDPQEWKDIGPLFFFCQMNFLLLQIKLCTPKRLRARTSGNNEKLNVE